MMAARPSALRRRERRGGVGAPAADRIVLRRIDMAVEPVRRAALFVRRRPRGDDAQIAIDLHGIGIDDHAAELFGERQRQRRLAARRRACNEDDPSTRLDRSVSRRSDRTACFMWQR